MPVSQSWREEGVMNSGNVQRGRLEEEKVTVHIQDLQAEPALPTCDPALVVWKSQTWLHVLPVFLEHRSDLPGIQNQTA